MHVVSTHSSSWLEFSAFSPLMQRKNRQINALMKNHEKAFSDIKNYYNDITLNNLALINSLKVYTAALAQPQTQDCSLIHIYRLLLYLRLVTQYVARQGPGNEATCIVSAVTHTVAYPSNRSKWRK